VDRFACVRVLCDRLCWAERNKDSFVKIDRCYCHGLMKLEFSRDVFEKYPNAKFNENPSSGGRVVPCGRTDGQTYEGNS